MEDNNQNEEIKYIKERMKQRPLNRKKLMRRTVITAAMAVIFGVLACFTFLVLEPVFTNLLYPTEEPEQIEIPEDTDEILPEDMMLEDEVKPVIQIIENEVDVDALNLYEKQYDDMYNVVHMVNRSLVSVTGVNQDTDWFDNEYESKATSSGLYVAENGQQLLFLTYTEKIKKADRINVTFYDGTVASGEIKQSDRNTGLSIVAVNSADINEDALDYMIPATLANSRVGSLVASPIIAIGRPYGSMDSVAYGILAGKDTYTTLTDQNYEILTTNIYGSTKATGIIVNIKGEVLGIIDPNYSNNEVPNIVCAIGISDLKKTIERMSNGKERSYLGVKGMDVTADAHESLGVPMGAYVTGIVMGSPAMEAGIQSGDVIVSIGGSDVMDYSDLSNILLGKTPDSTVTIVLMRQSGDEYREMKIEVALEALE